MPLKFNPTTGNLQLLNLAISATPPIVDTAGVISIPKADTVTNGYLSSSDWNTFNNKLDRSQSNYITNPDFEVGTTDWNLYNDSGNTAFAFVVAQDITFTAVAAGNAGNGINIDYIFHATQSYLTPLVTVLSPTHITVAWYNGPTLSNNPTATQLKAAYDAVPGAVALATSVITGTASNRQYETGSNITAKGGDTAPVDGTGGIVSGVTFTQNVITPLVGTASGDLGKSAVSEQGQGVSTNFVIDTLDKNQTLQISFAYSGSTGMVLGSASDVRVFIYDIGNSVLIPVTSSTIPGPINTAKTYVGKFQSSSSSNYRLILHIATTNASAWDLLIDEVIVNDIITATATQQVPSLVLNSQPISGAVTDHMCVMWRDSALQWVPATIAGAALPVFGDDKTQLGFATNIVGSTADIYIRGAMDGFSFGPFVGYEQYIDTVAGGISPLPAPFNDMYVMVGMAVSSTVLNIQFDTHVDLIANGSGVPLKGGLLSNSAINDGTGDQVLTVGTNGNVLVANSAAALGINWAPAVVATSPLVYTTATRALTLSTVPISSGGTGLTTTSQSFAFIGPSGGAGAPTWRALVAADIPTLNQNTTGSAAKWTTARNLAGNSVDGSANVPFANKFVVQGTADAGLSSAQFLGALGTGIVKNTTTTGVLSIAVAGDFPTLNQNTSGNAATVTTNANLTGGVTSVGNAATVVTNANLTGGVTSVGNATTVITNANLTGDVTSVGNATTIGSNKVLNSMLAQMPAHTFKGNNTAGTANALDLTANQLSAELNSGISNLSGVTGTTVTDALNTLNTSVQEVFLSAIKNAGAVTANTTIPTWTTTSKDTLSGFAASTGIYTVKAAGDYLVDFTAATTSGTPLAQIYKNGALVQTGTGSGVRTFASTVIPNCVVNDTITVALDSTLTLTSTATDTVLNISSLSGASSSVVNARYHGSTTVITSSLATVTYTTKDFDTQASAYSAGVYTIPAAGKYMIKASLSLTAATAAAGNNYDIIIRKNSSEIARFKYVVGAATQKPNTVVVEDLVSCALNDTIDIQTSAAGTTPSISNGTTSLNFFYINKVSN